MPLRYLVLMLLFFGFAAETLCGGVCPGERAEVAGCAGLTSQSDAACQVTVFSERQDHEREGSPGAPVEHHCSFCHGSVLPMGEASQDFAHSCWSARVFMRPERDRVPEGPCLLFEKPPRV